jgi:hypothetical protein
MGEKPDYTHIGRDRNAYCQAVSLLKAIFHNRRERLQKVTAIAQEIRAGIEIISPFIQETTQMVCPGCKEVCCISKHGYYTFEDLVYLCAVGVNPPPHEFGRNDSAPCQYLAETGCSMERSRRPSGCNWYFCDALLDRIETRPDYRRFDDSLHDIAALWMEMSEEFSRVASPELLRESSNPFRFV